MRLLPIQGLELLIGSLSHTVIFEHSRDFAQNDTVRKPNLPITHHDAALGHERSSWRRGKQINIASLAETQVASCLRREIGLLVEESEHKLMPSPVCMI